MAKHAPQRPTGESQVGEPAANKEAYLVVVRYWMGVTTPFPLVDWERFDGDVNAKLATDLTAELRRQNVFPHIVKDMCAWLSRLVEGKNDGYDVKVDGQFRLCRRKLFIGQTDSVVEAKAVIEELTDCKAIKGNRCEICCFNRDEDEDADPNDDSCHLGTPRYTFEDVRGFPLADLVSARSMIARIRTGEVLDALEEHARPHLRIVDDFHRHWKETESHLSSATPAESTTPTSSKGGFLGGADLAIALGVPELRRDAFLQQLKRKQRNLLGKDCFLTVHKPRPNDSRYLYRADSIELRSLAEEYGASKPA
jgi:hypothetical protein